MNLHKNIFSDAVVVITINIMIIPSTKKDMFWARLFVPWLAGELKMTFQEILQEVGLSLTYMLLKF